MRQITELSNLGGVGGLITSRFPSGTSLYDAASNLQPVSFLGVLVNQGPNRESDYSDSRYWVRSISPAQAQNATDTDPINFYLDPVTVDGEETQQDGLWLTASNLGELGSQTHDLSTISGATLADSPLNSTACTFVRVTQIASSKVDPAANDYANFVYAFEAIMPASPLIQRLGSITGHTGTGPVEWNPYQVTWVAGGSANAYNTKEPVNGLPGSLGQDVGTDGSVIGTSCFVDAIGSDPKPRVFTWDSGNSRWIFTDQNGAS